MTNTSELKIALVQLMKVWHERAVDYPSPDFATAAYELDALLTDFSGIKHPVADDQDATRLRRDAAQWPARAVTWTGQMAGFIPAETDRTSSNSGDVGGPSEQPIIDRTTFSFMRNRQP